MYEFKNLFVDVYQKSTLFVSGLLTEPTVVFKLFFQKRCNASLLYNISKNLQNVCSKNYSTTIIWNHLDWFSTPRMQAGAHMGPKDFVGFYNLTSVSQRGNVFITIVLTVSSYCSIFSQAGFRTIIMQCSLTAPPTLCTNRIIRKISLE